MDVHLCGEPDSVSPNSEGTVLRIEQELSVTVVSGEQVIGSEIRESGCEFDELGIAEQRALSILPVEDELPDISPGFD